MLGDKICVLNEFAEKFKEICLPSRKKKIDWLTYALCAPIVAHAGWEEIVRTNKYLIEKVNELRIKRGGAKVCFEKKKKALEFEALIYLHTASLATPLSTEWFRIYAYLFQKYFPQASKAIFSERYRLTEHERALLDDLRRWIFKVQMKAVSEKLSKLEEIICKPEVETLAQD